jgi:predicted nucleic acid-binding protein
MTADVFLDTNILVYAAIGTGPDESKRRRALELIQTEEFGTSAQVLQEFFVTVTRKAARPLSTPDAFKWIEQWTEFPCQPIDHQLVRIAIAKSQRYLISYWHGAIVAAAEALGAHTIYPEDLSHGQRYGDLRVLNPFA